MTSELIPIERRIIVRLLEVELEHCHVFDCNHCRQLREIIAKLGGGDSE